jgi:hypothetical protein
MQMLDKILSSSLECYRVTVRFYPADDVCLDAWIGAVFRNRFLYFAESVCDERGVSLRECLDELPLLPEHAYYNQMKGGFPKGVFFDFRDITRKCRKGILPQNIYAFHIVFIGTSVRLFPMAVQALEKMFADGIGHPLKQLNLLDIVEPGPDGKNRLLYGGNSASLNMPENAIRISDYEADINEFADIRLTFHTPTSLYQQKEKAQPELSYQHKMNGFPSFYQLVRSLTYRWASLSMLYGNDFSEVEAKEFEKELDAFAESSSLAFLDEATLRRRKIHGTPKKESKYIYVMEGYEGEMVFKKVSCRYLPLLFWGMYAAVGNNVQYGMGNYSVEVIPRQ